MVNVTTNSSSAKSLPPQPAQTKAEAPQPITGEIVASSSPVAKDLAQLAQNSGQGRGSEQETDSTNSHDDQAAMAAWTSTGARVPEFV